MGKTRRQPVAAPPRSQPDVAALAELLTRSALILTIALIVGRALMSETLREAFDAAPGVAIPPRGAGPTTSAVLNLLSFLPALLILGRKAADPTYLLRGRVTHMIFAAFALWAVISTAWSSDKFATVVTSTHMLSAAALFWSTTQLVRSWLRLRLIAGVCVGLLLAYLAHGMVHYFIDAPETERFFDEHRAEILAQRGWEEGSFEATQFERKIRSREMLGFHHSPNSYAAVIVLLTVVAAGAMIQRFVDRDSRTLAWPILIVLPVAIGVLYLTNSRTAFGTILIAAVALAGIWKLGSWLARHATGAFVTGAAAFVLIAGALVAHGMVHGSLIHSSLTFRWWYWSASAKLVAMNPLTGVGWSNFGSHYMGVRLPIAAEEVRDPHNFIVRAFVELGIIGGILILAWLARSAWELTRSVAPPSSASASRQAGQIFGVLAISLCAGIVINLIASLDWSQDGAFLTLEVLRRLLWLGLIVVGAVIVIVRSFKSQSADDRPAPWILYGLIVGLGVFFVHNLVDFALAEPGALMLFAVLLGGATGIRTSWSGATRLARKPAVAILIAGSLLFCTAALAFVIPLSDAEQQARAGDEALRDAKFEQSAGLYRTAFNRFYQLNADYPFRAARALIMENRRPDMINAMLSLTIATDPANPQYYFARATYELRRPEPDVDAVLHDFAEMLRRDPNNVTARIVLADAMVRFGNRAEAAEQYQIALQLNDMLHPDEPKRLRPDREQEVLEKLRALQ